MVNLGLTLARGSDHFHDIKADGPGAGGKSAGVPETGPVQPDLLVAVHGIPHGSQAFSGAGFDLHNHQHIAFAAEQIQFVMFADPNPPAEDFHALTAKPPLRLPFSPASK
jgi:hypothetical protein